MAFRLLGYLQGECQVIFRSSKPLITMMFVTNRRDAQPRVLRRCWNYLPQER